MDTPEKNRIGAPITGFEDSPVFNYINNLSPIKPVKSVHVVQIFHSLNFASPPSVFTSPHFNSQKDSRFVRRHQSSDLSKAESDDGEEGKTFLEASDAIHLSSCSVEGVQKVTHYDVVSADTQGKFDDKSLATYSSFKPSRHDENSIDSTKEGAVNLSNAPSQLASELPQTFQYDFGSPKRNFTSCFENKADSETVIASTPVSLVQFVNVRDSNVRGVTEKQSSLDTSHPDAEVGSREMCQLEQASDETSGCEWASLIADGADDLLILNSSTESEASGGCDQPLADRHADDFSSLVPEIPENNIDEWKKKEPIDSLSSCPQNGKQDFALQPGEAGDQNDKDHTPHLLPNTFTNMQSVSDPNEKTDDKSLCRADHCITIGHKSESQQQRGMRRRCLVFEAGTHKKSIGDNSNPNTSISSATEGKIASDDKQSIPVKAAIGPQHMIANIGLHLNSLATHSKDGIMVKQETLASGKRLISMTSSVTSFHSLKAGQKPMNSTLASNPIQKDLGPDSNEGPNTQNASRGSASGFDEQFHQTSPKKKKRRLSNNGESEGCKRCNCKKSKCLKLYCECFAAGVYCVEPCSCQECFNKPMHEDTVLATRKQIESRNPLAFAPKVVRTTESLPDTGEEANKTPASARHKRGCNCKKSSCHKKYCECFQGGVGCSINCRCEGCKNVFGRKDGTVHIGSEETEPEEEEVEASDKAGLDENLAITEINTDEQQCSENRMPSFQICRSSVKVPFFSHSKPPRSILASYKTALLKSGFPQSQPKPEKHFQIVPDDDTPKILRANGSPKNGVKVSSPNQKRVSPPHNGLGWCPGRKSGRKLLLQSIPPFPPLTPHCQSRDFPTKFT